jgi:hypothetical protein
MLLLLLLVLLMLLVLLVLLSWSLRPQSCHATFRLGLLQLLLVGPVCEPESSRSALLDSSHTATHHSPCPTPTQHRLPGAAGNMRVPKPSLQGL